MEQNPGAGIAIVTGEVSGRLVILDLDEGHTEGVSGLRTLRERGLALPTAAPMVRTPSGGLHVYLRWPGGRPLPRNFAGRLPGVDLRAEGGYAVCPPTTRPDGSGWRWEQEPDGPPPEAPGWLEELAPDGQPSKTTPVGEWTRLLLEGVTEGARNTATARLAGYLLRHGVAPEAAAALLLAWNAHANRPPLPEREVVQVVASIDRAERRRRARRGGGAA